MLRPAAAGAAWESTVMATTAAPSLIYRNEERLFPWMVALSAIGWLLLVVGTLGIALVYGLLIALFVLFAHAGFISHLKGNGVRITAEQYPDLHASLLRCCERVGLDKVPEAYLLRTDFFNALATRFRGRHFVVLFTDVVDALHDRPAAIDFYIGHELGHIHRKHLKWRWFLLPAVLTPLLGPAFRRAEEYTCDSYGAACCESDEDVLAAMAAIAAGDTRWKTINPEAYLQQARDTGGFWMSFNELTGDYPWLSKRTARALAWRRGREVRFPRRHKLAWFIAAFIPRFGRGAATSMVVTVALIGVLAAVAIPAYQDYVKKAVAASAYEAAAPVRERIVVFAVREQRWPASLTELGFEKDTIEELEGRFTISLYDNGVIGADVGAALGGKRAYLVLTPSYDAGKVTWACSGQDLNERLLPPACSPGP